MRLDVALVYHKLCDSRKEAQELIKEGVVFVNDVQVTKQTKEIDDNSTLTLTRKREFVSRGGEKLKGALLDVYGDETSVKKALFKKTAIDIGASTGGFTDCLVKYGVLNVTCIDVGTNQIHPRVASLVNVFIHENTDIRTFVGGQFDIIVADLSFIALEAVFDKILSFGKRATNYFILIKPQFEVGKGNTKKGIVKDQMKVKEVLNKYEALAHKKFSLRNIKITKSKLEGGDGNQEYFLCIT